MSNPDDAAARAARARRLRKQIDATTDAKPTDAVGTEPPEIPESTPESPRDFIQRRMKELDAEDARKSDGTT